MEKVIYQNKGGLGIILDVNENESDFFEKKDFVIVDENLIVGNETNLKGMFIENVRFAGVLKNDTNCMVFCLGQNDDLFEQKKYYSCFYFISQNRIANKYTHNSVRDFNWINNQWK